MFVKREKTFTLSPWNIIYSISVLENIRPALFFLRYQAGLNQKFIPFKNIDPILVQSGRVLTNDVNAGKGGGEETETRE